MEKEKLIIEAKKASLNSYSPYSHFKVGACILSDTGKIYCGTNVENASFGATSCAERNAVFNAVSNGERKFKAICIYNEKELPYPCGICRQVLSEFGCDLDVIICNENLVEEYKLSELLPKDFKLKN